MKIDGNFLESVSALVQSLIARSAMSIDPIGGGFRVR